MKQLLYGQREITYAIERLPRKTLSITVHPDQSVLVRAPVTAEESAIEALLRRRALWVLRQQRFFAQFQPRATPRQYIGGETHLYLGRKYRLRIRESETETIELRSGYLWAHTKTPQNPDRIKALLDGWYVERAHVIFAERLRRCRRRYPFASLPAPLLRLRRMRRRWGSCSKSGVLTLNTDLIRASRGCTDYVIFHELCHLMEHNHSPAFYELLTTVLPDWQERKLLLEKTLV